MEITRYKVGEKVRIKSIDWYNENKDKFSDEMSKYCGKEYQIQSIKGPGQYFLNIDGDKKYIAILKAHIAECRQLSLF